MSEPVREPVLRRIIVGDDPDSWRAAGFDVAADGTTGIGDVTVELVGRANGKRILSWSFAGLFVIGGIGLITDAAIRLFWNVAFRWKEKAA